MRGDYVIGLVMLVCLVVALIMWVYETYTRR